MMCYKHHNIFSPIHHFDYARRQRTTRRLAAEDVGLSQNQHTLHTPTHINEVYDTSKVQWLKALTV